MEKDVVFLEQMIKSLEKLESRLEEYYKRLRWPSLYDGLNKERIRHKDNDSTVPTQTARWPNAGPV